MDYIRYLEEKHTQSYELTESIGQEGFFTLIGDTVRNFSHGKKPNIKDQQDITTSWTVETQRSIKATYLNDTWLSKRRFLTGTVPAGKHLAWITNNGRVDDNYSQVISKSITELKACAKTYFGEVHKFQTKVAPLLKVIHGKDFSAKAWASIEALVPMFEVNHPNPQFKLTAGGVDTATGAKPVPVRDDTVTALSIGGVKAAALSIIHLFECISDLHRADADSGEQEQYYIFGPESDLEYAIEELLEEGKIDGALHDKWRRLGSQVNGYYNDQLLPWDHVVGNMMRGLAEVIDASIR